MKVIFNMKVILHCRWGACLIRHQKILPSTLSYLLEDVVVGWSITLTFIRQTVKQLEVIWKVVLSDISKLNDWGRWEQWSSSVELLAGFSQSKKMDFTVSVFVADPGISNRMMDHFMNEIIDRILQFCKFFHFSQNVTWSSMLIFSNIKPGNECRKTFKENDGDKKEWV